MLRRTRSPSPVPSLERSGHNKEFLNDHIGTARLPSVQSDATKTSDDEDSENLDEEGSNFASERGDDEPEPPYYVAHNRNDEDEEEEKEDADDDPKGIFREH